MEKQPLRVQLVKKRGESYQIKLPYLDVPVTVDTEIYSRMLKDPSYQFGNSSFAKSN